VRGEFARSPAMIAALPRKKANGEVSIRAIRTGTSSLMRVAFCLSRTETGSGRPRPVRNSAWDELGTLRRSAFPFAIRSAHDKRMALKLPSFASSARLALSRKKSSRRGMCVDPALFPRCRWPTSRDNCSRLCVISIQLQTRLRIADLRGSVTIDARGRRIVVVNGSWQALSYVAAFDLLITLMSKHLDTLNGV
jgi:hypothetical protein